MRLSRICALSAGLSCVFSATAFAQLGNKPVEVINPPGQSLRVTQPGGVDVSNFPATQTVDGTVNVGNFPSSQAVSGTVGVNNFPANQTVSGTVNVGNFPDTQNVAGTVSIGNEVAFAPAEGISHISQPIGEHFLLKLSSHPSTGNFGMFGFSAIAPDGGPGFVGIFPGQCMVILKAHVAFRSTEWISEGTIGSVPFGRILFEAGPSNGTDLIPLIGFVEVADESGAGAINLEVPGGLVITQPEGEPGYSYFGIRSIPPSGGTGAPFPRISPWNGWVSGYTIPC